MRLHSDHSMVDGVGSTEDGPDPGLSIGAAYAYASGTAFGAAGTALGTTQPDTAAYPYSAVVRIIAGFGGQYFQGSGVLISPDEVLTASHMVYLPGSGTATSLDVAPAFNGTAPYGHAAGTVAHYSQVGNGHTLYQSESQSDYAVIHLAQPFAGVGAMSVEADFAGGAVHVTGYPGSAGGAMVDSAQTVSVDPRFTLLDGTFTGTGSSGGPVWRYGADGAPHVVGLVSAGLPGADAGTPGTGWNVQITGAVQRQLAAWLRQDDGGVPGPSVQAYDATLGQWVPDTLTHLYTGPVAGVQEQYIDISSHSLNLTATSPNWFIHTGGGNDAITVRAGTNVLDGGAGSNFLSGGTGTDTFYVDSRGAASDIWSTVANFHAGDSATVWGVSPALNALGWADNQGAPGFAGLTLHASASGRPNASLTLAGFSQADMASGRLSVQYGYDASSLSSYAHLHANR